MDELKVFSNEALGTIRITEVNGLPYFISSDITAALGYSNSSEAILRHVDADDRDIVKYDTLVGGIQSVSVINESGLYSLIIGSKLPKAKEFKHWVTSEVLPSIRQNGGYISNQESMTSEQILASAVILAQNIIASKDKLIADMKPKADFFDAVADSKTAIPMDQVAKVLDCGLGRNKIFELLRNNSILQYNNIPYQKYVDLGYFRVVEQSYVKPTGENCVNTKTLVFQRGLDFIRRQIKKGE